MQRLNLYLFRQLLTAFVFSASAVAFVILFTQSFRMLSLVMDNSSTLFIFFELLALSVPTFLPLVLPLGLGVATIFVYNKLAIDSELVVMRAAGVSPMRQATPALIMAGLVLVTCFVLTLWITPAANRELVTLQYKIRDGYAVFLSRPGYFNDITSGLTFYAHRRDTTGGLEGILIHDVRRPDAPTTIMANTGQVVDNAAQPEIIVFHGRRQELDMKTGKLAELSFDQYVLDLNALRAASAPRLADPREQTITELLNPSSDMVKLRASSDRLLAELHERLASPFLSLAFTLIGLAAILAGEFNRRGMGKRILIASLAIIVVQAGFMSVHSLIAAHINMAFTLYFVPLLPFIFGLGLINVEFMHPDETRATKRPPP